MVPRADIVAVQQDVPLGELMKVFASAGHSRLVVYDDTLDDAVGMVHIRDLVAFMTARAGPRAEVNRHRKKPPAAGLDLECVDLSHAALGAPRSSAKSCSCRRRCRPSICWQECRRREFISRWWWTNMAAPTASYRWRTSSNRSSARSRTSMTRTRRRNVVRQPDGSFLADARAHLEDVTATVGASFDVGDAANEVDTLAGYMATRIGRVPVRGELVPGPGPFEIEVLDADPRRVKKLKIYRSADRRTRPPGAAAPARRPRARAGAGTPARPSPATSRQTVARYTVRQDAAPSRDLYPLCPLRSCWPGDGGARWSPSWPAPPRRWRCRR